MEGAATKENDLIFTCNDGSKETFTCIYSRYFHSIYQLAQRMIGEPDAADIVQEAFDKLWHADKTFCNLEHIQNYLYVTVRHTCIIWLQLQKWEKEKKQQLEAALQQQGDIHYQDDQIISQLLYNVEAEMVKLPAQCRTVFRMAFGEGLKNDEIANRLGISNSTVTNEKVIALKLLNHIFNDNKLCLGMAIILLQPIVF